MSNLTEINSKIAELKAQADQIKAVQSAEKLAAIKADIETFGFTVEQLFGVKKPLGIRIKSLNPAPIKYKGPQGETWTGRGLAPRWMSTLVAQGHTKEQYLLS